MTVFAFLRTSTERQDFTNQKVVILDYVNKENLPRIDTFLEVQMSTRKKDFSAEVHDTLSQCMAGDILIVSELSRLARDLEMLVRLVKEISERKIRLISLKECLDIKHENGNSMQTKIIVWLFSMLYDIERTMISERTKMGLARARAEGKQIGRPKGSIGKSRLDPHKEDIQRLRRAKVSYEAIGRLLGCRGTTVRDFVRRRALDSFSDE